MSLREERAVRSAMCLAVMILIVSPLVADTVPELGSPAPFAYHLRIVRVSGAEAEPGAALGWETDGGKPVIVPAHEAWGTEEQLRGLAATLGGERADAVTGFFVEAAADGAVRFHRKVYVQDAVVGLEFEALPPAGNDGAHRIHLALSDRADPGSILAEADLRVRTDRTVAIASPSPIENDWLVLAVTLVDQRALADRPGDLPDAEQPGIENPVVVRKVPPKYPEAARKGRVQGSVVVQTVIDKQGVPRAPMVVSMSDGCEELAAAAVDAVQQWRYEPARIAGEPVDVWIQVMVQFRLQ